ncbi:GNAT family N-acetyltransferase [Changchengzhania lutea]|uniref:GNAT family N-acetyltransferase n=1 Tax=Changchengzhania lutea TaxID=2049305 RepID=UPI00115D5645|nr:GNAT family N-acetyltransferase [Changchengzhania lutea]
MLTLLRTNSDNVDFKKLIKKLDAYLKITDGDEHDFYNQYNNINVIKYVVVAYSDNLAVGCGAIKAYDDNASEIKRMFTDSDFRQKGIASKILTELEQWSKELGFTSCILETGINQKAAIKLYRHKGYKDIPNYGPYINALNSLCFKKEFISYEKR